MSHQFNVHQATGARVTSLPTCVTLHVEQDGGSVVFFFHESEIGVLEDIAKAAMLAAHLLLHRETVEA